MFFEHFLVEKGVPKLEKPQGGKKHAKRYGKMPPKIAPLAAGGVQGGGIPPAEPGRVWGAPPPSPRACPGPVEEKSGGGGDAANIEGCAEPINV